MSQIYTKLYKEEFISIYLVSIKIFNKLLNRKRK